MTGNTPKLDNKILLKESGLYFLCDNQNSKGLKEISEMKKRLKNQEKTQCNLL